MAATKICFLAVDHDGGSFGGGYDSLLVLLYMTSASNPVYHWEPYAEIFTSSEHADFAREFWSGTYLVFDATLYGLPSSFSVDNVIFVDKDVLRVERHGNEMYVNLAEPQQSTARIAATNQNATRSHSSSATPFTKTRSHTPQPCKPACAKNYSGLHTECR